MNKHENLPETVADLAIAGGGDDCGSTWSKEAKPPEAEEILELKRKF